MKLTDQEQRDANDMFLAGMKIPDIAVKMDRAESTVRYHLKYKARFSRKVAIANPINEEDLQRHWGCASERNFIETCLTKKKLVFGSNVIEQKPKELIKKYIGTIDLRADWDEDYKLKVRECAQQVLNRIIK